MTAIEQALEAIDRLTNTVHDAMDIACQQAAAVVTLAGMADAATPEEEVALAGMVQRAQRVLRERAQPGSVQ